MRRRLLSEGGAVYLLSFAAFLTVAVLLDFKYDSFPGDAVSRMANGFYVLYSRDPHLAAVGFVWTPLQSIADLVLLLGNHLWSDLSHRDMAGSLVSALAMAGATYQICCALREWGVGRISRLALTAVFALNPMILFYAGNGMSEGLYLFTLVAATRYLLRWTRDGDLRSLAFAAFALGFSYLTRNEAAGAAVAGALAVWIVSYRRTPGERRTRVATAVTDTVIFGIPALVSAAAWAIVSYVITGHFFEQFSSIYGNSEQEIFLGHKPLSGRVAYEVHAIGSLAPFVLILVTTAVCVAVVRSDARVLAPIGVLGGALAFDMLAYLNNSIEGFYRYFIVTIPLEILLVGSLVAAIPQLAAARRHRSMNGPARSGPGWLTAGTLALIALVTIPATLTTAAAMFNPQIGVEESSLLGFIFHAHLNQTDLNAKERYPTILNMDRQLSTLDLPDGDIVVDNATQCVPDMLTTINHPKLFVIPNDRDFQRVLADPLTFHAHYILEPDPATVPISAGNLAYPNLWTTGAGFSVLDHQYPARGACPEFRLFHVTHHPSQVT
jgi:hypothetical protein